MKLHLTLVVMDFELHLDIEQVAMRLRQVGTLASCAWPVMKARRGEPDDGLRYGSG